MIFSSSIKKILLVSTLSLLVVQSLVVHASGPYTSKILSVQSTKVTRSDNVVFLVEDITDSPCASTNQHNRFQIDTEEKQASIFIAAAQDKVISLFGTGTCNASDIEIISAVRFIP